MIPEVMVSNSFYSSGVPVASTESPVCTLVESPDNEDDPTLFLATQHCKH